MVESLVEPSLRSRLRFVDVMANPPEVLRAIQNGHRVIAIAQEQLAEHLGTRHRKHNDRNESEHPQLLKVLLDFHRVITRAKNS